MDLRRALLHRWYLVVAGLLVTITMCSAAAMLVPPRYQAQAVLLLLPPRGKADPNPYLNLASLAGMGSVVNQAFATSAVTERAQKQGIEGTYSVTQDASSGGPLLVVSGEASTPSQARRTATYIASLVPDTLRNLQNAAGVRSPSSYVTSTVINPVDRTTVVRKKQIRALIAAAALGVLLSTLVLALVERRSILRAEQSGSALKRQRRGVTGIGARKVSAARSSEYATATQTRRGKV